MAVTFLIIIVIGVVVAALVIPVTVRRNRAFKVAFERDAPALLRSFIEPFEQPGDQLSLQRPGDEPREALDWRPLPGARQRVELVREHSLTVRLGDVVEEAASPVRQRFIVEVVAGTAMSGGVGCRFTFLQAGESTPLFTIEAMVFRPQNCRGAPGNAWR